MYKNLIKPIFDISTALVGLILISPIFLVVWLLLCYYNQGSPFFFQKRPGKNGQIFSIIKFKTMNNKKDSNGVLLPDSVRLTKIGSFIRKTSIDEIPQLFNVIKGDMSLIGPRPLLPEYLSLYTEEQKKRHLVRPGITGLAQVKGRNVMKFSERFINDVYYVNNLSFILDCKILLMTIESVLFNSGTIVNGQTVDEVDDVGVSKNLNSNHFKK